MKKTMLIILLFLALLVCSILSRQIIRSNERIREQIAELEEEIEQLKKPRIGERRTQSAQQQIGASASATHAANAELRKEKRSLEMQVAKQKQADNALDKVIHSSLHHDKRRYVTLEELEKLDPDAYAHHLESLQTDEQHLRETIEQRMNFIATMDTSLLSAEETEHMKKYLQLLNQANNMRLNGEALPKDMFIGYQDIRRLVEKYSLAAIGSRNPTLPNAQMSLRIWSQTPHYTVLNPLPNIPTNPKRATP